MIIHLPSPVLQPFIRHFMITEAKDDVVNRVLPNTAITIAFRLSGQVNDMVDGQKSKLPLSLISGLRKSNRMINYTKNASNLIVLFREGAAVHFIEEPLNELTGQSLSLDVLKGYDQVFVLEEQLNNTNDHFRQIALVEQFLLSHISNHKSDSLIVKALNIIQQYDGTLKMKELADVLCISQDAFEKRFRRQVGTSPKQFAYLVRMKSIIEAGFTTQTLSEKAFKAGYYDQSHFIKDFKTFTGLTPTDFLRDRTSH